MFNHADNCTHVMVVSAAAVQHNAHGPRTPCPQGDPEDPVALVLTLHDLGSRCTTPVRDPGCRRHGSLCVCVPHRLWFDRYASRRRVTGILASRGGVVSRSLRTDRRLRVSVFGPFLRPHTVAKRHRKLLKFDAIESRGLTHIHVSMFEPDTRAAPTRRVLRPRLEL